MARPIFHLSFPVRDLAIARDFYCGVLGACVGRETAAWIDILLFGHQLTLHQRPDEVLDPAARGVRHFGAILPWPQWRRLGDRLVDSGWPLRMPPTVAHTGTEREQGKILLCDPSDNLIEIKAYRNASVAIGPAFDAEASCTEVV